MLLNVHLTPGVVTQTSHEEANFAAPALRREVRELLLRHGVLRLSSGDEARELLDALQDPRLTQQEATEWKQLVMTLHGAGRMLAENPALTEGLETQGSLADLTSLKALQPILSVLPPETYSRIFPSALSGMSRVGPQFEAGVPGSLTESQQYANVQKLAEVGSFPKGTSRDQVWRDILAPFSQISKHVYIFDKYLFAALAETSDEHVTWLLRQLDRSMPPGSAVTLIGARGIPSSRGEDKIPSYHLDAEDMLRRYLPDKFSGLTSVRILLAPSIGRKDMHHDRHIRFSAGAAFEFPAGFDRLGYPQLGDTFGFTYRYSPQPLRELQSREDNVNNLAESHDFDLL